MSNTKKIKKSFLGTGWSFPPTFSLSKPSIKMVSDDVLRSLQGQMDFSVLVANKRRDIMKKSYRIAKDYILILKIQQIVILLQK